MATQKNNVVAVGVHGPARPWVYKRLVEHDGDFVGLIAYGLYKKRKTELAESHRASGHTEDVISIKLKDYHDQVVVGDNEIQRFRSEAQVLLHRLLGNATMAMQASHEAKISSITEAHEKSLKETRKQAIDDVSKSAKQAKQSLGMRDRCVSWLMDGVQSTLAGIFVTVVSFGGFSLLTPDNIKVAIASKAVQALTGTSPAEAGGTK